MSGHGYGHAARQQAVIRVLAARGIRIHVRSTAPAKFFSAAVSHRSEPVDAGMIQPESLHVDPEATFEAYKTFLKRQKSLIQTELAHIKAYHIRVIVSDMPPVAFEIAERANIPGVLLSHFHWLWVYQHYIESYPDYQPVLDAIAQSYQKATLALQMPFAHDFSLFKRVESVPLVVNTPTQSAESVRKQLNIPHSHPMILLSMGGHQWGRGRLDALRDMQQYTFLVQPDMWGQVGDLPNFRRIPKEMDDYHNLLAAADVVVGKAGGSTVAEVIAHRTPMIYTVNDNWCENELLHTALRDYGNSIYVPRESFEAGNWIQYIPTILDREHTWREIATNGATVAADRLMSLL